MPKPVEREAPKKTAPAPPPKPKGLAGDSRLQASLDVVEFEPELKDVLRTVEKATGVKLVLDKRLDDHRPRLGSVEMRSVPAWVVMNWIASRDLVDGRWEEIDGGYRLTAKESLAKRPPAAAKVAVSKTEQNRRFLSTDLKLRAPVSIIAKKPALEEVLQQLREATHVDLALDPKLERHDPEFGSLELRKAPAWVVMGLVAEKDLVDAP